MSDGRKRIRVRTIDPRTRRMKEVDRIVQTSMDEALRLQRMWKDEVRFADRVAKEIPRLSDYVESWLRSRVVGLKASTATTYAEILGNHVLPKLGDFFIDKITEGEIRQWMTELSSKRAAATVNGALTMLRMVLEDAVSEFQLARNPGTRVKRFPVRKFTDDEPNLLSPEELGKVLSALKEHDPAWYPLALTLALTGLRYGEATALKWSDIDEAKGLIGVVRAQWKGIVSTPKTDTRRTVPLVPELAAVLLRLRADQELRGFRSAEGWIFTGLDGKLLQKSALRFPFARALKRAGIRQRVSVHGLRRTFNNIARQIAGDIVTRAITGHVTADMTEHYSHVGREEKLKVAGQIVRLVPGLVGGDVPVTTPSGGSGGGSETNQPSPDLN
jgi:integrase